jgi:hypothetical protein
MNVSQAEFHGFPASQVEPSRESDIERFLRLSDEKGGLIPQNILPDALGLSTQRVSQLVTRQRFEVHQVGGHNFVTGDSFAEFLQRPVSKGGRPRKNI